MKAQVLSKELPEITVVPVLVLVPESNEALTLGKKRIEEMMSEDVGQLLSALPGINIRNYGGLGGLKTLSYRGIGGQHTTTLIDGFSLLSTQTGQTNYGQVQSSNLEKVVFSSNYSGVNANPEALLSGQVVTFKYFLEQ